MTVADAAATAAVVLGLANTVVLLLLVRSAAQGVVVETRKGLPLGAALPAFEVSALDGRRVTEQDAASHLLLFLGASCRPCHQIARELASAEAQLFQRLLIMVTGDPPRLGDNIFELLGSVPGNHVAHDSTREIADRLGMPGTPFVYAVDPTGRIRAKSLNISATSLHAMAIKILGPA
jgi:hypothetical protein